MRKVLIIFACFGLVSTGISQVYKDKNAPVAKRVSDLLSRMTLKEKVIFINGVDWMYTNPIKRLDVPSFKMSDGPVGTTTWGKSTAYPASILSAATWDTALVHRLGTALGKDARSRGVNFLLGPGVEIARAPMTGRNFEYLGEDPFLSSTMAVDYIQGVQSQGVVATVKHFAANNEEYDRNNISSDIDERTLNEIYLAAFKAAVQQGKVGAVMNSYNRLNGEHTSENSHLNNDILKKIWGFQGLLMSDWVSVYDRMAAFKGGTDLEMPGNRDKSSKVLLPALEKGEISEKTLNDKVSRILRVCFKFGFFDRPQEIASIPKDNPDNAKVALDLAREGVVLLKNEDHVLPFTKKVKTVLVMGPNAQGFVTGGGSSKTNPFHYVSLIDGLTKLSDGRKVVYFPEGFPSTENIANISEFYTDANLQQRGLKATYFNNKILEGAPLTTKVEKEVNWNNTPKVTDLKKGSFSIRYTGFFKPAETEQYALWVKGDDGFRIYINDSLVMDEWSDHPADVHKTQLSLEGNKLYRIKIEYYQSGGNAQLAVACVPSEKSGFTPAIQAAKTADAVVLSFGFDQVTEGEGHDRPFSLPPGQSDFIKAITKANPNTVVVINAGGNVDMQSWLPSTHGLLQAWYPGQEGGQALAEIIYGKVNPSGKLPVSFEKKWEDNPTYHNYYDPDKDKHVVYKEKLKVGYRYYDQSQVKPQFPFGFGLSYTKFRYSDLKIVPKGATDFDVQFTIKNTGDYDGAEIAQLYIHQNKCDVFRPVKELKGFTKVFLKKGASKTVSIVLDKNSFSYYKIQNHAFGYDPGAFTILVGPSSEHIELQKELQVK